MSAVTTHPLRQIRLPAAIHKYDFCIPLFVIFVFWCVFILWRASSLGFYHDDWSLLTVTSKYGEHLIAGGRTRPLNVALGYLGVSLFGLNTVAWHLYGALLVLANAAIMYGCCRALVVRVLPLMPAGSATTAATLAASAWMLFPWGLGYTAWPAMFPGLYATAMFSGALWVLAKDPFSPAHLRWSCYLLVLASLIYEAFWFAFLPMSIMVLAFVGTDRYRTALRALLVLGTAQFLLIAWNQMLGHWGSGGGKQLNAAWLNTLLASFTLPIQAALSLYVLVALTSIFTASVYRLRITLTLIAASTGMFVAMGLYAIAGYSVAMRGLSSRTFIAIDIWLALGIAVSIAFTLQFVVRWQKKAVVFAALALLVALGGKNLREAHRWSESWEFHRNLLAKAPFAAMLEVPPDSVIVLTKPNRVDDIDALGAYWDTTAAIYVTQPAMRPAIDKGLTVTLGREQQWLTTWDGQKIKQSWCVYATVPLWTLPARKAYLINKAHQLESLPPRWSQAC